jgi:hypothetical protein
MLYCSHCKTTVERNALVTPAGYKPIEHLDEPSDLACTACPNCRREIAGAWAEYKSSSEAGAAS